MVQTRHAFARLVPVMGESILSKIPPLIGGLLRQSTTGELIDFLPFLGQLIHKFKVVILADSANMKA
jgi:exportin-T